ncbi:MAG TPA: ChaN family lipoprotein [Aurantimonas sp.]|nr:ChaN family lipoprotein [Aurantimonas sp.]
MGRFVWIPACIAVFAGLGFAAAGNVERIVAKLPLAAPDEATFVAPEPDDRVRLPYTKEGGDTFVAVATAAPFDRDGEPEAEAGAGGASPAVEQLTRLAAEDRQLDEQPADGAVAVTATKLFDSRAPRWTSRHFADNPLVGGVFRGDGLPSSATALLQEAGSARYVLLGEIHDNPDHHRLQADIVADLARAGTAPSVVFEMIPDRFAPVLESFGASGAEDLDALADGLEWAERGWPDFSIYRPIFETVVENGLSMAAGNLDEAVVGAISRSGIDALAAEDVERLGLNAPLPAAQSEEMAEAIREAHCGLMPERAIAPMGLVQRAGDGAMADALIDAAKQSGSAVLIAGAGHVRNDRAVPAIIAEREPRSKSVSVQMVEVTEAAESQADYGLVQDAPAPYDFTIFTPRANVTDHCAELRERMGRNAQ